jgi:hypothetical protein
MSRREQCGAASTKQPCWISCLGLDAVRDLKEGDLQRTLVVVLSRSPTLLLVGSHGKSGLIVCKYGDEAILHHHEFKRAEQNVLHRGFSLLGPNLILSSQLRRQAKHISISAQTRLRLRSHYPRVDCIGLAMICLLAWHLGNSRRVPNRASVASRGSESTWDVLRVQATSLISLIELLSLIS